MGIITVGGVDLLASLQHIKPSLICLFRNSTAGLIAIACSKDFKAHSRRFIRASIFAKAVVHIIRRCDVASTLRVNMHQQSANLMEGCYQLFKLLSRPFCIIVMIVISIQVLRVLSRIILLILVVDYAII